MVSTRRQQQQQEAKKKREETLKSIYSSIRKRGKTLSSTLSNDVASGILSRVPVEDLLQFQFACKSWYTLLHEPFFINLHLNQSISNKNFAFMVHNSSTDIYSVGCDISSSLFKLNKAVKINNPFRAFHIYGSCNGIFLMVRNLSNVYRVCLWNPSTGEYKEISNQLPKMPANPFLRMEYWLGYDLSRDDYKVIRMGTYHRGTITDVYVYSMRTNSCKRIHDVPYFVLGLVAYPHLSSGGGILLNDAIHWLGNPVSNANGFLLTIVSFDLANDEFKGLQLPDVLLDTESKRLGVFEDCLCIYHVNKDSYIDVFMMKEYGVKESWTKMFSINDQPIHQDMRSFKTICITNNGKLLVLWNHTYLALYDPKHGGRKCGNIKIEGLPARFEGYGSIGAYVKSLVSLGANTCKL
ncbi:hypothetical protein AQUCO_05600087v1 [Aquilegia coerulea]|uniref:F-box domain-containing protein n=1 Tax=Aquilegia coerulea TaxID=218851 RepID=A0A2G5CGI3_AQUCA|nr:hypothetical protein AQUCO_05600087v1 [Aquilegia coerulea]